MTVYLFSELSSFHIILGIISITGGFFILSMAYHSFQIKGITPVLDTTTQKPLLKGILTNSLSPHPYLFWFSVGAPIISKANGQSSYAALVFIISFYACLLGSKCFLAIVLGKTRSFLNDTTYNFIMRLLGVALCVLAMLLFYDGLNLLSLIEF